MPSVQTICGFGCQYKTNPESWTLIGLRLKVTSGDRKSNSWATAIQRVDFSCWHLIRLRRNTWNLCAAGKSCHLHHPSGVNQSRALWARIFTNFRSRNLLLKWVNFYGHYLCLFAPNWGIIRPMSNFHAIPWRTKVHSHCFKLNDEVWI